MSVVTTPRAPRAMLQRNSSDPSTLSGILNDAARKFYPRLALYEALATFKEEHMSREPSIGKSSEHRRDFLDSFAYLCDTRKGGATVTAAALQRLPQSNILWLAANEGISKDVESYALVLLGALKGASPETQDAVATDVFLLAVEKCSPRIEFYKREMQKHARNCRMQLRQVDSDDAVRALRIKLKKLSEPHSSVTLAGLVDTCYRMRGAEVESIRARSTKENDDFVKLAHYLGRLGATRSNANTVARTMLRVSALREISTIRIIEAPEPREVTMGPDDLSPYEIVREICTESPSQDPGQNRSVLHAIVDHDLPIDSNIRSSLNSRKVIVTRVHAELQIVDQFSRYPSYQFVDGDKYIGCSKPACYFCYNWICNHKYRYVPPATHHKIIAGCRGPDSNVNEAGATVLKDMYNKMCGRLNQDILQFLLDLGRGNVQSAYHYMSTEGSSRAPSQVSMRPPAP